MVSGEPGRERSKAWLAFVAFWTGLVTMALEVLAARVLAPAFGTSTVVWTSVIAVVLLALSLGYIVGGRLAERRASFVVLARLLIICGVLVLLAAISHDPIKRLWGHLVSRSLSGSYLVGGSLFSALILFGVPVLLLGMVSPLTLSLAVRGGGGVGTTSGKLFALGTLGGLIGTFLPTFVLVPFVGSTRSMLLLGASLGVLGGVLHPRGRRALVATLGLLVAAGVAWPGAAARAVESRYQTITVRTLGDGGKAMLFDTGFGWQSLYQAVPAPTGLYFDVFAVLPPLVMRADRPARVLVVGVAGGTTPRQLHHFYGERVALHGVELDPEVTAIARRDFGLGALPMTITDIDGRAFVANTEDRFDLVIVDVYRNEFELPWSVATVEFWRDVKRCLSEDGVVAMNVSRPSKHGAFVSSIGNTIATVFADTRFVELDDLGIETTVFIASTTPMDTARLGLAPRPFGGMAGLVAAAKAWPIDDRYAILTDEHASPEVLLMSEGARIAP